MAHNSLEIFSRLQQVVPKIQKNVMLKHHTTFRIGGPADYFLIAENKGDVIKAIKVARGLKIPVFIMGGGSNLLVSDEGLRGLVIKIESKEPIRLQRNNVIVAPAGMVLGNIVAFSIQKSLQGLEWAGGLPGTFGGAIRGNAGAFGGEIKDAIFSVEAIDEHVTVKKLSNKQCKFSYRSSIFKLENWVILSASVKLKKGNAKKLQEISDSHVSYRKEKHPLEYPNAGSVFKNVDFKLIPQKFQYLFLDKVKQDPFPIVPAAWFIIGAGLAGKKIGQAQISKKHSNYIVNTGNAKAKDIIKLISFVKEKIKKKYGIDLEPEVQFLEK